MSINYSPADFSICYRPIQFSTTKTRAKATPLVFAKVTCIELPSLLDITSVNIYPTSIVDNATNPTTESDVTFVFDIARVIQDYFASNMSVLPSSFVSSTNTGAVAAGTDTIREFTVVVEYYVRDANGLVVKWTGNNTIVSNKWLLNATAQHTEDFALTDYIVTSGATNYIYTATKNRGKAYTCRNKPFYLNQITDATSIPSDVAYAAYKNGSVVGMGVILAGSTSADPNVYTIDVGTDSIQSGLFFSPLTNTGASNLGYTADDNTFGSLDITDFDCIKYWFGFSTIDGEAYDFDPNGFFNIVDFEPSNTATEVCYMNCCNEQRVMQLYWINEFGVVDSYVFNSTKVKKLKTDGKVAIKGLSYDGGSATPHNINQVGSFKFKNTSSESFELKSQLLTPSQLNWIQYLCESPYVFTFENGQFIPVTIESGEFQTSEQKNKVALEVIATLSNNRVTHRR